MLLAIDPGKKPGWATFDDRAMLLDCSSDMRDAPWQRFDVLVIERPEVYRDSKADPNNIVTLALNAGRWIERALMRGCSVFAPLPKQWKGQVPKEIHNQRTLAALSPSEERLLRSSVTSDMLDAVGLGKWFLFLPESHKRRFRYEP